MTETAIVDGGMRLLHRRGAWAVKVHGGACGRNGIPDILATYRGRPLALEFKQPGRHPTRLQQHELDQAAAAGAITAVITSVSQLAQLLDDIDGRHELTHLSDRPAS